MGQLDRQSHLARERLPIPVAWSLAKFEAGWGEFLPRNRVGGRQGRQNEIFGRRQQNRAANESGAHE